MSDTTKSKIKYLYTNYSIILIFLIMFVLLSIFVPYFFTWRNMVGLALSVVTIGLIANTMMFALASGDFDLSVSSTVAFSGITAAVIINNTGNVGIGILVGVLAGGLVGLINGFSIAKLGLNALITTLATQMIFRGMAFIFSNGRAVGISQAGFFTLGNSMIFGIPTPIVIMVTFFVLFGILLNNTVFGKNTLAIGGNTKAAELAGINVDLTKIIIFTAQGFMAGFAGVILASRMTSGQPNAAQGLELDVISACVLGGVSLNGGIATMSGVVVGVLIMGMISNALNLLNVATFYQYVVRGSVLLIAIYLDILKQRSK
ncbi:L-arabinose ABC transporter membrane protein [Halanaerobium congolense]|uniref:L-arabinose ABC transporter membrane protein n=1 Tax=Halanaerobium congolense TaxID=54121 RepID=A0A4R8GHG1_9FIRM|nr:L-arabinose ABC transporter permease AraH [Halanaerobium congolense]TDX45120.1 L-arabinose ABC transporter membrane protein [Halanaerobium congolense]